MIQRCDLFGGDDDVAAHRQHQNAGAESQRLGMRGEKANRSRAAPRNAADRKFRPDVVLGGHVVVAPHRVIAERFGMLGDADQTSGSENGIG